MNLFARFAGKFACITLRKHKRGKLIRTENGLRTYRCPRCETVWSRKVKNETAS